MEDKKVFTVCNLLLRGTQITAGMATVFFSILQIEDLIESTPLFARSEVFHSSGLDICETSLIVMGTFSVIVASFLGAAGVSSRMEGQLRIYMRPYRLIVTDIIFLVCWAFSMPMLVIEYPENNQNFVIYKLLLASCVINLISWSSSTGLDCCQFGDLLISESENAVDEDATVIPQSTISGLEDGTLRLVCDKLETPKPENAIIRTNARYLW
ncbi:uncharacterized protein V1513DRAFT_448785 [Lipomyces chichibuensis]|uniref:uncharacterized protein n=1 Tax=Lipomyces chichibuensis TaxID=1546026 RepID=UPI0033442546